MSKYTPACKPSFTVFLLLLITGCTTTTLWSGNTSKEYIKIIPKYKTDDVELALKETNRKYYCEELYASTYPNNKICFMEKQEALKLKEKIIATPEALATDVAASATITFNFFGYIILGEKMSSEKRRVQQKQAENPNSH